MFRLRMAGLGVILVGVAGIMFFQARDLKENYVKTSATIKAVTVDCYIENAHGKIVEKDSNHLAYMDCAMAPIVAQQNGYKNNDIHKRAQIDYVYLSPVDDNYYKGSFTRKNDVDEYAVGAEIQIFSHKTEPEKSKTPGGNLFLGDANV